MAIGVFLFAGVVAASGTRVPDPLVAHTFQWALYKPQLEETLEPPFLKAEVPEALTILSRDGLALIEFAAKFRKRPDLAMTGMRNLMAMVRNMDTVSGDNMELGLSLSGDVTFAMSRVVDVVIQTLERLQHATVIHTSSVLNSLSQVRLRDRMAIRAGMVELNGVLLNVLITTSTLRFQKRFHLLVETFRDLGNFVGDLDARDIGCLADPLGTELRNIQRLLATANTIELYHQHPSKRRTNRKSLLAKFICSLEYAGIKQAVAADSRSPLQQSRDHSRLLTTDDLYGFENISDLIEFLKQRIFPVQLVRPIDALILKNSLSEALFLYEGGSLSGIPQTLHELRFCLSLVTRREYGADTGFVSDVLLTEVIRLVSLLSSRVIHVIEGLEREPDVEMQFVEGALSASQPFFGYFLRIIKQAPNSTKWITDGDELLRTTLVRLVIVVAKIGASVGSTAGKQQVGELVGALKMCEGLFKKLH